MDIPAGSLSGDGAGSLTLNTGIGSITIPGDMLPNTELTGNAGITRLTKPERWLYYSLMHHLLNVDADIYYG